MNELLSVGLALALFITSFMMLKENKKLNEKILIWWVVFLALPLLARAFSPVGLFPNIPAIRSNLVYPITYGPFLWLYVRSLVGDRQELRFTDLLHFLPFPLVSLYQLLFVRAPIFNEVEEEIVVKSANIIEWIVLGSLIGYTCLVICRLRRHNMKVIHHFSMLPTYVTLEWLNWVTVGFVVACILPITSSFISLPVIFQSHAFAYTGFIFILGLFGLKQAQVFTDKKVVENPANTKIENTSDNKRNIVDNSVADLPQDNLKNIDKQSKYKNSGLTQKSAEEYLERLESHMLTQRPYLDANLTIEKLAKQISIPRHYLTQIISEQLNKNFYLYVNEHRVIAVKQLLRDPRSKSMTMLEIAYESGFNSKSTFNTVFKKITDVTPSKYKELVKQSEG